MKACALVGVALALSVFTSCQAQRSTTTASALSGGMAPDPAPPSPAPELPVGLNENAALATVDSALLDTAVAYVAGDPIDVRELLAHWAHRDSRSVFDFTDRLVTGRLALAEANRLGVKLDPQQVDERVNETRTALAGMLEGSGVDVDRYLMEKLGLDPTRYFELVRDETVMQLMSERAVRAWTLGSEHAEVAVIVVATKEEAEAAVGRLNAGEVFEEVARALSMDPSAENGGLLPPVVKSEMSVLSRLAFRTKIGEWGGPIAEGGSQILIKVKKHTKALEGAWDVVGPSVEADLSTRPVEDPEYWQWRGAMGRRYKIDMRPLFRLLGEPLAQ